MSKGIEGPLTTTLEGRLVRLEPFAEEHRDGLWEAAQADEIWAWLAHLNSSRELFDYWFDLTLKSDAAGEGNPAETGAFAVRRRADGLLVGSSRYLGVRRPDRVVEIGWTWFNPSVWRTGVNVETKLLMFTRAFETLGCVRVELKTDARNERSRGAMAALPGGVRGDHAQAPDHPRRRPARQRLLQRHRRRMADVRAALQARLAAVAGSTRSRQA